MEESKEVESPKGMQNKRQKEDLVFKRSDLDFEREKNLNKTAKDATNKRDILIAQHAESLNVRPVKQPERQSSLNLIKANNTPMNENIRKIEVLKKGKRIDGHEISPDPLQDDFFKLSQSNLKKSKRGKSVIKEQVKGDKKMYRQVSKTRGKKETEFKMEEEYRKGTEERNEGVNYAIEYDKQLKPSIIREKSKEKTKRNSNKFEEKKRTQNITMMNQMKDILKDEVNNSEPNSEPSISEQMSSFTPSERAKG